MLAVGEDWRCRCAHTHRFPARRWNHGRHASRRNCSGTVEDVAWDRITRVCWECGEWLCMDNFYLMDDHEDREWVVPSAALGHGRLVDVLDRRGIFPTKTYVA